MIGPYIQAVETRLSWLRWLQSKGRALWTNMDRQETLKGKELYFAHWYETYIFNLSFAETFYMNKAFCSLVAHAGDSVPNDLVFDRAWLQTDLGWLYQEINLTPVENWGELTISAFGWQPHNDNSAKIRVFGYLDTSALRESVEGFLPGVGFDVSHGQTLGDVVENLEVMDRSNGGRVAFVRWVFAGFHLMSQRMAVTVNQKVDRAVRRRAEKAKEIAPDLIKVITLRRMEEDRKREGAHAQIDWQWQWAVRGHWRSQFYPSENVHKPVFVEAYIKGPTDKPFKSPGLKVFAAVR